MQNQDQSGNDKVRLTKREYNRKYYEKNKHLWKKPLPKNNVFDIFGKGLRTVPMSFQSERYTSLFRTLEISILIGFAVVATLFLIREAASFYLDEGEGTSIAYVKAIMIEGFAILFSISRCRSALLRWTKHIVVILLCSFTLWVMSGKLVKTASSDTNRVQALKQTLDRLESEIQQKEQLRQALLSKNLLTSARRYEKGLDQVRERRDEVQRDLISERSPQVISNNLKILIVFRLLLVLGNLVSIHTLMERFRRDSSLQGNKNGLRKVELS